MGDVKKDRPPAKKRKRDYEKIKDNIVKYQKDHPRITLSIPTGELKEFRKDAETEGKSLNRYKC